MRATKHLISLLLAIASGVAGLASCTSQDRIDLADEPGRLGGTSTDASLPDAAEAGARCPATTCPDPFTTCPDSRFPCDVDLLADNDNCGACGNVCPGDPTVSVAIHAAWFCRGGACVMSCEAGWGDANDDPNDGCEVSISCDPKNCGGVGNACAPGVPCIMGICGCAPPLALCGEPACGVPAEKLCFDLQQTGNHCGSCENDCNELDPSALWPNMQYGCQAGKCEPTCADGFRDCNGKVDPDGCETEVLYNDANCGACGNACAVGFHCGGGECICTTDCPCAPEETVCYDNSWIASGDERPSYCAKLDTDPRNCGHCLTACQPSESCRYGRCFQDCPVGFADCNGNPNDGCELHIDADPYNCGGCGITCDVLAGQPCIRGQCLTVPCEQVVPK